MKLQTWELDDVPTAFRNNRHADSRWFQISLYYLPTQRDNPENTLLLNYFDERKNKFFIRLFR